MGVDWSTVNELITAVLILLGGAFLLIASIGILRMPDLMLRMHATSKGATLGAGLIVLSVATFYWNVSIIMRALAAVFFIFITASVAAHVIARAAYIIGVRLWPSTVIDELEEYYKGESHKFKGNEHRVK